MTHLSNTMAAAVMAVSLGSAAQASQVTFDLTNPDFLIFGPSPNDLTVTRGSFRYTDGSSGLELTTSAFRFNFDQTLGQQVELVGSITGLGVYSDLEFFSDSDFIDSFGPFTEAVSLEFSKPVRVVSALFNYWDDVLDDFTIVRYAPDGAKLNEAFFQDANCLRVRCSGNVVSIAESDDYSYLGPSSQFAIGAEGFGDAFTLLEVTVAPIPLPAAGWLMLAGLGGLAVVRRRRGNRAMPTNGGGV